MSYVVLYRDTGSVIGHHTDRRDAIRDAVLIALDRPELSFIVGLTEVGDDGTSITPFVSASDLLAANDEEAVALVDEHDDGEEVASWGVIPIEGERFGVAEVRIEQEKALGGVAPSPTAAGVLTALIDTMVLGTWRDVESGERELDFKHPVTGQVLTIRVRQATGVGQGRPDSPGKKSS